MPWPGVDIALATRAPRLVVLPQERSQIRAADHEIMCGMPERCASTVDTHSRPNGVRPRRSIHRRTRLRNRSPRPLNSRYTSASRLLPRECSSGLSVSTRKHHVLGIRTGERLLYAREQHVALMLRAVGAAPAAAEVGDSRLLQGIIRIPNPEVQRPPSVSIGSARLNVLGKALPSLSRQGSRAPETAGPVGPRFRLRRLIPVSTRARAATGDVGSPRDHARVASPAACSSRNSPGSLPAPECPSPARSRPRTASASSTSRAPVNSPPSSTRAPAARRGPAQAPRAQTAAPAPREPPAVPAQLREGRPPPLV